jgi:hypothetical protein
MVTPVAPLQRKPTTMNGCFREVQFNDFLFTIDPNVGIFVE